MLLRNRIEKYDIMFNRIKHKYSPIGLDLAATAMRAVQLVGHGDKLSLHAALEIQNPLGAAPDADTLFPDSPPADYPLATPPDKPPTPSDSTDIEQQQEDDYPHDEACDRLDQLRQLIDRAGMVGRDVVLHCPPEKMDMRPISLPAASANLPRHAIIGAVKLQVAEHLTFPPEQAVFDYFLMDHQSNPDKIIVMAITADGRWIQQRLQLLQAAGLQCRAVDALPCVLARVAAHHFKQNDQENACDPNAQGPSVPPKSEQQDQPPEKNDALLAVLDIAFAGSTLVVLRNHQPIFSRRFALGGLQLTQTLAQRLGVDFQRAEMLKKTYGIDCQARQLQLAQTTAAHEHHATPLSQPAPHGDDHHDEIAKTIYAALQTDLADYLEGLTRSLNYIINDQSGTVLQGICLCGSGAQLKNFDQFLAQQVLLPVRYCDHPLNEQITNSLPVSRCCPGAWTTALGLALAKEQA